METKVKWHWMLDNGCAPSVVAQLVFLLHISYTWVKLKVNTKNHLPRLP